MHIKYKYIVAFIIILSLFSLPLILSAQQTDFGIIPNKTYLWFNNDNADLSEKAKPLVQIPPLCGKKRRDMGHDLAMPFGVTADYHYYKQYYLANDLQLIFDSTGLKAVGEAAIQNSTVSEKRLIFRPDVWILPFLNIYGIAGYTQNITNPNFDVHEVTILAPSTHDGVIKYDTLITLNDTVKINDELGYYGSVYGVGASISSGYKNFFFVLDYHYTVTKPRDLEDKLESHNFSGKIGVLLGKNKSAVKGAFWFGTMFINDNHRFTGKVDTKEILEGLELIFGEKATYSGTVNAKQYWNLVVGGSVIVNKHHIVAIEAGFYKREQFSVSYGFRF